MGWEDGAMLFGYCRVSTRHQVNDRQVDALVAAGVELDNIFQDKITGTKFVRRGLSELLTRAREGDVIMVASMDRLGRSLSEVIRTADDLHRRGIVLKTIKESIDYSSSIGRMLAGIFATLAQYELDLIHERADDARAAAKARGKQTGRPSRLTGDQERQLVALRAADESISDLVVTFKVSRATVYRVLAKHGMEAA
jgi:DNA invertase Pin-like site-specific DNA recombinase